MYATYCMRWFFLPLVSAQPRCSDAVQQNNLYSRSVRVKNLFTTAGLIKGREYLLFINTTKILINSFSYLNKPALLSKHLKTGCLKARSVCTVLYIKGTLLKSGPTEAAMTLSVLQSSGLFSMSHHGLWLWGKNQKNINSTTPLHRSVILLSLIHYYTILFLLIF